MKALGPLVEQLDAPKNRTIGQLSLGERNYMTSIVTFRAEDGAALGRILTLSDISQVRRLAMEKERFIRTMVHELEIAPRSRRSLIEVATDKSLGNELDDYLPMLRRAENRIDNLVQLIGDLLALSRSEQAQGPTEPELLEIEPAVSAVLALQSERLAARNISAHTDMEPDLPPYCSRPEISTSYSPTSSATRSSTTAMRETLLYGPATKVSGCE